MPLFATMFCMNTMSVIITTLFIITSLSLNYINATNYNKLSLMATKKHNISCILVFGDSSVDPGNNNKLSSSIKSNFLPYGKDFFNGHPSGRFCNGKVATDFIAEAFGYTNLIKAFLDPAITKNDLLHGVSFASAASGYDDYTDNLSNVLSLFKQLEYFKNYKIQLKSLVGSKGSEEIIQNAIFVLSMGTNDFLLNYYANPTRSKQYNLEQYQNYLISRMCSAIKKMHSLGARRLVVVGVPPFGCMPLVRTFKHDVELNKVAFLFNLKIQRGLKTVNKLSRRSILYPIILNAVENPLIYGFTEPLKGCCGSGTYEYGFTCKNLTTCTDRTKYVFWDALHFTEKMYKIIADAAMGIFLSFLF